MIRTLIGFTLKIAHNLFLSKNLVFYNRIVEVCSSFTFIQA